MTFRSGWARWRRDRTSGASDMIVRGTGLVCAFALSGCASGPPLEAVWYYYDPPPQFAPATVGELKLEVRTAGSYLAVVNNGAEPVEVIGLAVNSPSATNLVAPGNGGPRTIPTGETQLFAVTARQGHCAIPVLLYLSMRMGGREAKARVRVKGGLPGSLPDEWVQSCSGGSS